ncbi:MAG: flagellar biosynthesis protein FlhF [Candidatus Omnitrophica bacterium]|nr:flagellar biosynthesis protein FlhF [Candidatus Omnitrophota bacterium]MBD3269151.1 flagellar biosynthesis protein FlhF [Candidatus Omnitrophota bacterium]
MKVKRYQGKTMQEVMARIKLDLGPEAKILFVKEITGRRFFRKSVKSLEVIAGVEESSSSVDSAKLEMIRWELKELKDAVKTMGFKAQAPAVAKDNMLHPSLRDFKEKLCEAGVEEEVALDILKDFQERSTEQDLSDQNIEDSLIKHVLRYADVFGGITAGDNKIVAFIGPTGVGKTTTVAKLAAHFSLMERKRVAFITIDTYRIAAVDQLKTYAEIIGIPIEVVFNPQELLANLNKNKDKDLILIDTAGSNPFDAMRMEDLKKFLGQSPNIETHLLMNISTRPEDLIEIYNCYNVMKIHKVILTKLDEAKAYGNILNLSYKIDRPISYVTTGQNVPDDIEIADAYHLMQLVLKGEEGRWWSKKKELEKQGNLSL